MSVLRFDCLVLEFTARVLRAVMDDFRRATGSPAIFHMRSIHTGKSGLA